MAEKKIPSTLPKNEIDAVRLEEEHVHKKPEPMQSSSEFEKDLFCCFFFWVYDEIADNFSHTRHKPWPQVTEFIGSFPSGSIIFDVGCGNGKYLNSREDLLMIGTDRSQSLLNICRQRNFQVFLSDCLKIAVRSDFFDGVICIAVIHHLSTEERRLSALREIVRVVKPSGRALITVWAKEQQMNEKKSTYISKQNQQVSHSEQENGDEIHLHKARTEFQRADCLVPWTKSNETFLRFYHVFVQGELERLLGQIDGIRILESFNHEGNWCSIFTKI